MTRQLERRNGEQGDWQRDAQQMPRETTIDLTVMTVCCETEGLRTAMATTTGLGEKRMPLTRSAFEASAAPRQ